MCLILMVLAIVSNAPPVMASDDNQTGYAQAINQTPGASGGAALEQYDSGVVKSTEPTETVIQQKDELPPPPESGSPWWKYLEWAFYVITGSVVIRGFLMRWIKTAGNIDKFKELLELIKTILGFAIDLIGWLLAGFVPNRSKDGGTHD